MMTLDLPKPASVSRASFVSESESAGSADDGQHPGRPERLRPCRSPQLVNLREFAGQNAGYGITRTYQKFLPDGGTEGIESLRVGDMVLVRLEVEIGGGDRYLAIDDPLPAVFEAVNPEFDTANVRQNRRRRCR